MNGPRRRVCGQDLAPTPTRSQCQAISASFPFLFQRYWALVLNLSASALFFFTIQEVEVSLAVPLSNGTTFVFTALVGHLLLEKRTHPVLVPLGICLHGCWNLPMYQLGR